jgi:ribonuclease E
MQPAGAASAATEAAADLAATAEAPAPSTAPRVLAEPYVLPVAQLHQIAQSSGLQWVNSDADKIAAAQAAIAAQPQPVHVPRERKPMVVVDEGPLVLVETRKDLSQMKLPFETAAEARQG